MKSSFTTSPLPTLDVLRIMIQSCSSIVDQACEKRELNTGAKCARHGQLLDRADLDTSFLTLKRVHLNLKSKIPVE